MQVIYHIQARPRLTPCGPIREQLGRAVHGEHVRERPAWLKKKKKIQRKKAVLVDECSQLQRRTSHEQLLAYETG